MEGEVIIQVLKKPEQVWKRICSLQTKSIQKELEESILVATLPGINKEQLNIQSSYDTDKMHLILTRLKNYQSDLYEELDNINRWKQIVSIVYTYFYTLPSISQRLMIQVYQKKMDIEFLSHQYLLSKRRLMKIIEENIAYIQKKIAD